MHRLQIESGSRLAWLPAIALAAAAMVSGSEATTYYMAVDVPALIAGAKFGSNQIFRREGGGYLLENTLPAGTQLSALERLPNGVWMLSPAHGVTLGGVTYEPRDVVSWDGVSFAIQVDGSAMGIPEYARIDSLVVASKSLVISFDVDVDLGGTRYGKSDLVKLSGSVFSLYWSGDDAGVPSTSNVVGAGISETGKLVVSFDVPTTIAGTTFQPGQLVQWDNPGFSNALSDPYWPASSQLRDFSIGPTTTSNSTGSGNSRPKLVVPSTTAP